MEDIYLKNLCNFINKDRFIRCFYGKCPECEKRIFSVGDDVINNKIRAKFVCSCGKKYKETVYSPDMGHYKYQQALAEEIYDAKFGNIKVLKFKGKYLFITPEKIRIKTIKHNRKG